MRDRLILATVLTAAAVSPCAARVVTMEERIGAQTAIERVYWAHRLWPAANPDAKPAFESSISAAAIRGKVEAYLQASGALDAIWTNSPTPTQLQAEIDRMTRNTRDSELLRDLFAALGDDPSLVAECLARPILVDRQLRNRYARDERFHGSLKSQAEAAVADAHGVGDMQGMGGPYDTVTWLLSATGDESLVSPSPPGVVYLSEEAWAEKLSEVTALVAPGDLAPPSGDDGFAAPVGPPVGRISPLHESNDAFFVTAVLESAPDHLKTATVSWAKRPFDDWWRESRSSFSAVVAASDTAYTLPTLPTTSCVRDTWSPILSGVPDARAFHTAVWTGVEMIVWGGGVGDFLQTGGRYNPATDTWMPTSLGAHVPPGRLHHTAVWTGTEMIVWGGNSTSPVFTRYNTGGRYNPTTDVWAPTGVDSATPVARYQHTAVWTGREMIIWGGSGVAGDLDTGGRYDPSTDGWTGIVSGSSGPGRSWGHTAVWTGSEMIVWGVSSLRSGSRYNPITNAWVPTGTGPGVPASRFSHVAVWTGSEMIVWGGLTGAGSTWTTTGGRYDPSADAWSPTSTGTNVPVVVKSATAVWADGEMIVWGAPNGAGARYSPLTDSWRPTASGPRVPFTREFHTAVWTGSEMIVWGGRSPTTQISTETGGRYDPVTDRWTPTSVGAEVPTPRWKHTAVWTGNEMLVWGGGEDWPPLNTGGRYVPATDSWSPTSVGAGVPDARREHVAVWTGREMLVWGGDALNQGFLSSGGLYDPANDSWRATTSIAAPVGRFGPTAVWTGREMIVWGGYDYLHESRYTNTGGRYDPLLDRWRPTPVAASLPQARLHHSAVWTGDEMLVWGGSSAPNTVGDRYDPNTDSWRAMGNGSGVPSRRSGHTAIWTGTAMIVFGGGANTVMNSGARYDPTTDGWLPIDAGAGVPSGRSLHSAVWAGAEMIVWGGENATTYLATGGRYDPLTNQWSPTSAGANTPLGHVSHTAVWTGREMLVWGGLPAPSSSGAYCACPDGQLVYRDADGDSFGDPALSIPACDGQAPAGYVPDRTDCDDADPGIHPGAAESCNGRDDNCDGVVDEGGDLLCDDGDCCTIDTCSGPAGCGYEPMVEPPVFLPQPSLEGATLWPPNHDYVDFEVADTSASATSSCGIASIQFASCSSSQPENGTGTGDGNSVRDCVYEPGSLHLRAERDGACSPIGRVYSTTMIAVDVCGNVTTSSPFSVDVWHDRAHPPAQGTVRSSTGNTQDIRTGTNGNYGIGCGTGSPTANGLSQDHSDADPEMEIAQDAAIDVNDLQLSKESSGSVELTWGAPVQIRQVTRFHVWRLDPIALFWMQVDEVSKQTNVYRDPALNDGRNWQYKVTAVIK